MRHAMNLMPIPFEMIKSGQKTIELRLNDEKRQLICIYDEIEFINMDDISQKVLVEVINVFKFESFNVLYKTLPLIKCGYTQADIDRAEASDMDIYYTKEKQVKYGVLGIEVKLI